MPKKEIIKVDLDTETICCDGDEDSLGHPAVYFTFESQKKSSVTIVKKFL